MSRADAATTREWMCDALVQCTRRQGRFIRGSRAALARDGALQCASHAGALRFKRDQLALTPHHAL
jgi:hypothetical protein